MCEVAIHLFPVRNGPGLPDSKGDLQRLPQAALLRPHSGGEQVGRSSESPPKKQENKGCFFIFLGGYSGNATTLAATGTTTYWRWDHLQKSTPTNKKHYFFKGDSSRPSRSHDGNGAGEKIYFFLFKIHNVKVFYVKLQNLTELKEVIASAVMKQLDHKNIDVDVDFFRVRERKKNNLVFPQLFSKTILSFLF